MIRKNRRIGRAVPLTAAMVLTAAFALSCDSSILSGPPAAPTVALVAAPAMTKDIDSMSLSFSTTRAARERVEYGTAPGSYTAFVSESGDSTATHSLSMASLAAGTTYYYRIVSVLDDSRAFSSPEYSAATEPAAYLTAAPVVVSSQSSLTIEFTTSKATIARIQYGTTEGAYAALASGSSTAETSHTLEIPNLAPGTVYYYRVASTVSESRTYTSPEYSAATASEGVPSASKARGIWLVGGISATSYSDTVAAVDLFDPVTAAWYPAVTSLPTPVSFAGYAAYGGKLFVVGGFDKDGNVRDLVQIYDIAANSWSNGQSMNAARANICATVLGGKIYVLGGSGGPTALSAWNGFATTYEYSIAGDSWTVGGRTAFGAAESDRFSYSYGNAVYDLGGRTAATTTAATHDGFVPSLNALLSGTTEVVLPAGRAGFSGAAYAPAGSDAFAMIIGGISVYASAANCFVNSTTSSATTTSSAYCLAAPFVAPAAWVAAANAYPQAIAYGAAALSASSSPARIYQFGGTSVLGSSAAGLAMGYWSAVPESASSWAATWTAVAMPRGRWGHGAVSLNG